MKSMKFDETDRKILDTLQRQGRITNTKLASTVGISQPATLERVRRLEAFGVISGYRAVLDRQKIGLEVLAFVSIRVAVHQSTPVDNIKQKISELPEVLECYQTSGDDDLIAKVAVKDIHSYTDWVMNRLAEISDIGKIKTSFVISSVKKTEKYQLDTLVGRSV